MGPLDSIQREKKRGRFLPSSFLCHSERRQSRLSLRAWCGTTRCCPDPLGIGTLARKNGSSRPFCISRIPVILSEQSESKNLPTVQAYPFLWKDPSPQAQDDTFSGISRSYVILSVGRADCQYVTRSRNNRYAIGPTRFYTTKKEKRTVLAVLFSFLEFLSF